MTLARHLPRFRKARAAQRELSERESWPRERLQAFQLDRLNELWRHITLVVPHYRRMRAERALPPCFASVGQFASLVPVLDKSTVVANPREFLSESAPSGAWHSTSGSTGTPMRVFRSRADHQEMLRAKYRFYASWGADVFDRVAWLWSARDGGKGAWAQRIQDRLRNRLRLSAASLGEDALRDDLRRIERFRPAAIYGYSRAVYMLALAARSAGFRCDSIRFVCLTGETATAAMKRAVADAFGAPAIMEYGSVDCGFLAGESPDDRTMRVRADMALIETVERSDGLYDILVTALTNRSYPLLRYRIGDVTDQPIVWPACGMPVLHHIAGRDDDVLIARDGRPVHATAIDELFETKFAGIVARYRVDQSADGAVCVTVELRKDGETVQSRFDADALARCVRESLDGARTMVRVVDAIGQTAAGKHRLVHSELAKTRQMIAEDCLGGKDECFEEQQQHEQQKRDAYAIRH